MGNGSERRWRLALLAAVIVFVCFSAVLVFQIGDDLSLQWFSNLSLCAMPFVAAMACFWRARGEVGRARTAWLFIGGSALSWSCGQMIWTYYESFVGNEVPFPSYADLGYLLAVPLLVAGLLLLASGPRVAAGVARTVLDGMVVATSLLLVSWEVVLETIIDAGGDTNLAKAISLSYPVGDIICASVAIVVIARTRIVRGVQMGTLLLLTAGTVLWAVADSGFTYFGQQETYYSGHPIDIGWFGGYLLLALAALSPGRVNPSTEVVGAEHTAPVWVFAPYVPVVFAVAAASFREWSENKLGVFMAWGLLVLIILVVVHQILASFENVGLGRSLRARTIDLGERERWFRSLVQNSSDVVTVVDEDGRIQYQTPSIKRVFGYEPDSLVGHPLESLVPPGEAGALRDALARAAANPGSITEFEIKMRHQYGEWCDTQSTITSLVDDPNVRGLVLNTRDTSAQEELEARLSHQAFHDALTGLANRELFLDRVGHALERIRRDFQPLAVLFLDLDGFKGVNDSLGHARGDELLVLVAERLSSCLRPGDTVARLGGDEFGILLDGIDAPDDAPSTGRRIREVLGEPFVLDGREVLVQGSLGIAVTEDGHATADELLRNADLAMYRAKTSGSGGIEVFETSMHSALVRRMELENDLRHALERDEFLLHYQPVLDLQRCRLIGVEALVRWQHPSGKLLSALDFIPLSEETGLISDIGAWVLREACIQGAAWHQMLDECDKADFKLAVNLSGRQVGAPDLIGTIERALRGSGLPPSTLVLEMTESVMITSSEDTVALLRELKELGIQLAIDDFGTGYSSLSYLSRFPVDMLKIDRSFVEKIGTDAQSAELVQTIVQLGRSLDLQTVAEGVETSEQLGTLRRIGCTYGQGFLFSRPVPADEITAMLATGMPPLFRHGQQPELVLAGEAIS